MLTSANTSLNQIPALLKNVPWEGGELNLDYGGGKYDKGTEYLWQEHGVMNLVYDPYNREAAHNWAVMHFIDKSGGADTVTCANVLNVIQSADDRREVLCNIKRHMCFEGTAYFMVYEGDRSGVGKQTGPDQWQENRKTADYIREIEDVFEHVYRKGKLIVARR